MRGVALRVADGKILLEAINPRIKLTDCPIESDEA
jgi:hypothetical protein